MIMIHKIAEVSNLSPLVIETGFLLLLTFFFVVVVFLVLAIFRIKNEMIKMSYTTNYMTRLIERGYKDRKLYKVNYDLKTEQAILDMLQKGKSCSDIVKNICVSGEYVEIIEDLANEEGLLPKKPE